jgi:hypothetical protein
MEEDEIQAERQHLKTLRAAYVKRLRERELQRAGLGVNADPVINTEIASLTEQIAEVDLQLRALSSKQLAEVDLQLHALSSNVSRPPAISEPSLPVSGNPFTPGAVVAPERFFGRKNELRAILARLEGMLSISLVGDARMGKSSLLRYLHANLPDLLGQYGRYLPIQMSTDELESRTDFHMSLLESILPALGQVAELRVVQERQTEGSPTLREARRVLQSAAQAGIRVVLLLDESKSLLTRPTVFDETFLGALRALYMNRTIALVLASRQPLTSIPDLNLYFANGITMQNLDLLTDSEAEALLRQPHDRGFSDAEVQVAQSVGKKHPLRLQLSGWYLYRWKESAPSPAHDSAGELVADAADILLREVEREYNQMIHASGHP